MIFGKKYSLFWRVDFENDRIFLSLISLLFPFFQKLKPAGFLIWQVFNSSFASYDRLIPF
jgi:hypothetical protein